MFCAVVAHGGIPKVSTYSVSKAALNACTKMHAYELRAARIRCVRNPLSKNQETAYQRSATLPVNMFVT